MTALEVLEAGPLTTIQDLGRPGLAHIGVPPSGAADPAMLAEANALAGNADDAPALEATLVGPTLRALVPGTVAVVPATSVLGGPAAVVGSNSSAVMVNHYWNVPSNIDRRMDFQRWRGLR